MKSDADYKGASAEGFCGITTKSEHGVVDTAAEGGLIGSRVLERLSVKLEQFGLTCKKLQKRSSAKGVGGQAKVVGVVLIPIGIGGLNGVLEATVVEGEVPLLLPVRMLRSLKVLIDFSNLSFTIPDMSIVIPMHELASGHVTIEIMEFAAGGFEVSDANAPCCTADFQKDPNVTAMLAHSELKNYTTPSNAALERNPERAVWSNGGPGRAFDREGQRVYGRAGAHTSRNGADRKSVV